MTGSDLATLVQAVQTNCHIADARHAADMTLCTYLLQMREFYRWERGTAFGAPLDRAAVGAWIAEREAVWDALEAQDYAALPLGDTAFDPFDVAAVNAGLQPHGLLYGAGLVSGDRPVFFLADLHAQGQRDGVRWRSAGRELARGLLAPVAMLDSSEQPPSIVVRRESLARWCWEKFEAFSLRRSPGSAFHAVVQAYGLDADFEAALPRWIDEQAEAALLHELGEYRAGQRLGPAWTAMRLALPTRRGELHARAVRDHLADLAVTLPTLLARQADASMHVWFANLDGVRELLFPSLKAAYAAWCGGDRGLALLGAMARGQAHFERVADVAMALHVHDAGQAGAAIEAMLTSAEAICPA